MATPCRRPHTSYILVSVCERAGGSSSASRSRARAREARRGSRRGMGRRTSERLCGSTTPLTRTLVDVPRAGRHERVRNDWAARASRRVGSRRASGAVGVEAEEGEEEEEGEGRRACTKRSQRGPGGREKEERDRTHGGAARDEPSHRDARLCERRTRRRNTSVRDERNHAQLILDQLTADKKGERGERAGDAHGQVAVPPVRLENRDEEVDLRFRHVLEENGGHECLLERRRERGRLGILRAGGTRGQLRLLVTRGSRLEREGGGRTLPGTKRLTPLANGANLTSTLRRALALKGALGGVGFGPYLRAKGRVSFSR